MAFAEVEKLIDTPVKHYSSGMYVRLAFAVAAHRSTWLTATPGAGDPVGGREKAPAAICRKVAEAEDGGTIKVWGNVRMFN